MTTQLTSSATPSQQQPARPDVQTPARPQAYSTAARALAGLVREGQRR